MGPKKQCSFVHPDGRHCYGHAGKLGLCPSHRLSQEKQAAKVDQLGGARVTRPIGCGCMNGEGD
jgi:hypothetical protein